MQARITTEEDAERLLAAVCRQAAWDLRRGYNAGEARSFLKALGLNDRQLSTLERGKNGNTGRTTKTSG